MRHFLRKAWICAAGLAALAMAVWFLVSATLPMHVRVEHDDATFTHVYVNTTDAQRSADFYEKVFGGVPLATEPRPPDVLVQAGARTLSIRTAGYGGQGPVLTFIERGPSGAAPLEPQELGFAHICFEADDVPSVLRAIAANGGTVISRFDEPSHSPVIYAKDPDGNVVEVHIPLPSPFTPGNLLRSVKAFARSYWSLEIGTASNPMRLLHVNINTLDWSRTLGHYESAQLGRSTGFQRDYEGDFIGHLTGVRGAKVKGRHLALHGYSAGGPTLEIFTYTAEKTTRRLTPTDMGRIAIGFEAPDPQAVAKRLVTAGFSIHRHTDNGALLLDPEGNHLLIAHRGHGGGGYAVQP